MKQQTLTPGTHVGMRNGDYHADRTAVSKSWLDRVAKTPYHLRAYLDAEERKATPALVLGSATDCLIFEPDQYAKQFVVLPEGLDRRTKEGKALYADLTEKAIIHNATILTNAQHLEAIQLATATLQNPKMKELLADGTPQTAFVWQDPITGLLCKCKADWYNHKLRVGVDHKTARSANPFDFSKSVGEYRYHVQAAFYSDGIRACGKPVDDFVFAVIEKADDVTEPDPHLMAFYSLTEQDIEEGRSTYLSDLAAINFALMNDEWPGYTNQVLTISRPSWAKRNDTEAVS